MNRFPFENAVKGVAGYHQPIDALQKKIGDRLLDLMRDCGPAVL